MRLVSCKLRVELCFAPWMSAYDVLRNRGNFLHPSRITRCVSPPPGLLQNKSYKNYKRIIAFLVSIQDDCPRLYFTRLPTLITIRAPTPSLCQNLLDDSFRVFLRGCPTTKVTSDRLSLSNGLKRNVYQYPDIIPQPKLVWLTDKAAFSIFSACWKSSMCLPEWLAPSPLLDFLRFHLP